MKYIKIVDWDKFQHYTKRNPPWIKLHTSLLDNEAFECLHNDSKVLLICLWLFTARKGNGEILANLAYLQRKLPVGKKVNLQPLMDAGFIECYQDDSKVLDLDRDRDRDKTETEKETKKKYLSHVFLSETEYKKLIERFGKFDTLKKIKDLDDGIAIHGYKYKDHYRVILKWAEDDGRKANSKTRLFPIPGKICSKDGCRLPAVYKDSSGSYDFYRCSKHLSDDVKKLYE